MNRLIICVFILVAGYAAVFGQKPAATPEAAKPKYEDMLAKVQSGDTKIDYRALRMAYSETKEASPFGSDREARSAMNKALGEKRYKDAIKSAEQILKKTYVNPFAHMSKAVAHRELGETDKFEFHKAVYLGLLNSILNGADGKTPSTAYVVISTEEEYAVMQALGYAVGGQSLKGVEGHTFDVLHGTDKSGNNVDVYFNIDIVWAMENRMFKPKG